MDIESWEWKALPEMISSGSLNLVSQLLIEFHGKPLINYLSILRQIYEAGFRIFWFQIKPAPGTFIMMDLCSIHIVMKFVLSKSIYNVYIMQTNTVKPVLWCLHCDKAKWRYKTGDLLKWLNSYELFYERTSKRWHFNLGHCDDIIYFLVESEWKDIANCHDDWKIRRCSICNLRKRPIG